MTSLHTECSNEFWRKEGRKRERKHLNYFVLAEIERIRMNEMSKVSLKHSTLLEKLIKISYKRRIRATREQPNRK